MVQTQTEDTEKSRHHIGEELYSCYRHRQRTRRKSGCHVGEELDGTDMDIGHGVNFITRYVRN